MLDISEITYFQYKKNCLVITTFDHYIYLTEVWNSGPVCAWRGWHHCAATREANSAPSDTQVGPLINYNDIDSFASRNH